jgi:ribosomal protein S12 methylthiotransferase accessory factor
MPGGDGCALNTTLRRLTDLLDSQTGIITSIEFFKVRSDDPQFVHCHATITDTGRLAGGMTIPGTGGTALSAEVALGKAIGESVERYCGEFCDPDSITLAPFRKIRTEAIDPGRFVLFHPSQYSPRFPFRPPSHDASMGWMRARSLTYDKDVLVPASLVHVTYPGAEHESLIDMNPVSGYACGNSFDEAALSGICEVVERDAFMIFWYNRLPAPAFDLSAAESPMLKSVLVRYQPAPVSLYCADITTEAGIPVALALMVAGSPRLPAAVVATAAHLDTEQAITKALFELAANQLYVRSFYEQPAYRKMPRTASEVVQPEDHGLFYCSPNRLPYLGMLTNPLTANPPFRRRSLSAGNISQDLDACVRLLAAAGLEVIVADLTTPDVADLGFKVVKVLIPGMYPIDFGHWHHLGGRRLYETPVRLGYRAASGPHELNLFPHPFP